jgi:mono/diheme cytochrome c family protein
MRRLVALAWLAGVIGMPPDATRGAESGEADYARACAECHRSPARLVARYALMYPEDRRMALDDLLKGHYAPDPAVRARIIAWLETKLPRR